MRSLHLSRAARDRHGLGGGATLDVAEARRAAQRINLDRAAGKAEGPPTVTAGELIALDVLHEVFHRVVEQYDEALAPGAVGQAVAAAEAGLGRQPVERAVRGLAREFGDEPKRGADPVPPGHSPAERRAAARAEARREALVEAMLLAVANEDPAAASVRDLFDDRALRKAGAYPKVVAALERALEGAAPTDGKRRRGKLGALAGRPLPELLRAPSTASPTSLAGQLRWIREHWAELLEGVEGLTERLLLAEDLVVEEGRALHQRFGGGGPGPAETPDFGGLDAEPERFSNDTDWMPRVVLQAKSTHVWLDQLSRWYGREIRTIDQVPDEELDKLARWGITGLWLIGLWERSHASAEIKHRRGNPDAVASAYSLDDYRIADDLGGEEAYARLRDRAAARGIRLASDMVPNHMGIDSRWVVEHPERFLALSDAPYPAYQFSGPDLSSDPRVEILLEDHYWDSSDAAVVFRRRDTQSNETRFIYHGNDGTSFPWNDTAQLDFLQRDVREAVIRVILDVARRFPIIRFDAAMVLAKRHVRRLWWPEPGAGGGIPSRAEHALSRQAFEAAMPTEFWRDVVDRVAAEVPDTLLLAEAFWLMEGYFVRTLGMHRVYNSAFMHLLRDEDNAGYRRVIRETLEFDPAILGRYVNFLTNPDEETAIEQFGTGDKYFGAATLLATLPGLPMVGHGQVEGFTEKYGMEFRRAQRDERPNQGFIDYFEAQVAPLFRQRRKFAGSADFRLYDLVADDGSVNENVYAYSNGRGVDRSLIVFHNRFGDAAGRIQESVGFAVKADDGSKSIQRQSLADALALGGDGGWLRFRDRRSGHEGLVSVGEVRRDGLRIQLGAYAALVLEGLREVGGAEWDELAADLGGRWVPSLDEELARRSRDRRRAALEARAADPARPLGAHEPAREHRISLPDGRTLAAAEWGDPEGRPVLLLHGRPGSRLLAPDPTTTELLGVRLVTYDRPGYGESDAKPWRTVDDSAEEIAAIADALALGDDLRIVGWSSGGAFAFGAAAALPDRIPAISVVAGGAPIEESPGGLAAMEPDARERAEAIRRRDPAARELHLARAQWYADDPTSFFEHQLQLDRATPDAELDADARMRRNEPYAAALRTHWVEGARQGAIGFVDDWLAEAQPWTPALRRVRARVDLWWGEEDQLTTGDEIETLARLLPTARVHRVAAEGHSLPAARWREILEAVLEPVEAVTRPARRAAAAAAADRRGRSRARGGAGS